MHGSVAEQQQPQQQQQQHQMLLYTKWFECSMNYITTNSPCRIKIQNGYNAEENSLSTYLQMVYRWWLLCDVFFSCCCCVDIWRRQKHIENDSAHSSTTFACKMRAQCNMRHCCERSFYFPSRSVRFTSSLYSDVCNLRIDKESARLFYNNNFQVVFFLCGSNLK